MKIMMKPIVVVGSLNIDLTVSVMRSPRSGETVPGTGFEIFTGGKGANQAASAARLGHPVQMIGMLGEDAFAARLLQELAGTGVETHAIGTTRGPSGVAVIVTTPSGENSIIVVPGANGQLSPAEIERHSDLIGNAALVLTQLETPLETVEALAEFTHRHAIPLILDPAPARSLPSSLLSKVDWITPNETEAQTLTGCATSFATETDCCTAAEHFMRCGVRNVLLKLGERGAFLATQDGIRARIAPFAVTPVDTTAAGDAFNGGLAVGLARGLSAVNAAQLASAVAAISVTRHGALPSLPSQDEVSSFLAEDGELKPEFRY